MNQHQVHVVSLASEGTVTDLKRRLPLLEPLVRHYRWLMELKPWTGSPRGFNPKTECLAFDGTQRGEATLWRPGAVSRWAPWFVEERLSMWAILPAVSVLTIATACTQAGAGPEMFGHSALRLVYSNGEGWTAQTVDAELATKLSRAAGGR